MNIRNRQSLDIPEISEALLNHQLFFSVQFGAFVFDDLLECKRNQRLKAFKAAFQPMLCLFTEFFGKAHRPVLIDQFLTSPAGPLAVAPRRW